MTVIVVVEGDTDLPIVRKLAADAGLEIDAEIDCAGKDQLDADLASYNAAAQGSPWFVLRDLNSDAICAGAYLEAVGMVPSPWMCFRIAVREMESWLLADADALAAFLAVPLNLLPANPDAEPDPTRTIVNLARQSIRRGVRQALVPKQGASAAVGPLYEAWIIEFGQYHWDLGRACARSGSLRSARRRLQELGQRWHQYVNAGAAHDDGI